MQGETKASMRVIKMCVSVSLSFTSENLPSWNFSALYALTTLNPVRFSLVTPLSLSFSLCTLLNLGVTMPNTTPKTATSAITHAAVAMVSAPLVFFILSIAHTAVTGADTATLKNISVAI